MVRIRDEWLAELEREDAEAARAADSPRRKDEKLPTKRQLREQLERKRWGESG